MPDASLDELKFGPSPARRASAQALATQFGIILAVLLVVQPSIVLRRGERSVALCGVLAFLSLGLTLHVDTMLRSDAAASFSPW